MCMLGEWQIYVQDSLEYEVVNGLGCLEAISRNKKINIKD